jgi:hypothetical protein
MGRTTEMQRTERRLFQLRRTRLGVGALGAILFLFDGADHYYEYSADQYSVRPTIGTLFLLNFIFASALGLHPSNTSFDASEGH